MWNLYTVMHVKLIFHWKLKREVYSTGLRWVPKASHLVPKASRWVPEARRTHDNFSQQFSAILEIEFDLVAKLSCYEYFEEIAEKLPRVRT